MIRERGGQSGRLDIGVDHRPPTMPATGGQSGVDRLSPLLQAGVSLVDVPSSVGFGSGPVSRTLGGQRDRDVEQDLMVGFGQAEPAVLEVADPGDHLAVGVLMKPGGAVGGVGGHVSVQDNDVVLVAQRPEVAPGGRSIQGEQHRHRVDGPGQITVAPMQRLAGQIGGDRLAVARERQRAHRLPSGFEGRPQTLGQRAFARAIESLDHDQQGTHSPLAESHK